MERQGEPDDLVFVPHGWSETVAFENDETRGTAKSHRPALLAGEFVDEREVREKLGSRYSANPTDTIRVPVGAKWIELRSRPSS